MLSFLFWFLFTCFLDEQWLSSIAASLIQAHLTYLNMYKYSCFVQEKKKMQKRKIGSGARLYMYTYVDEPANPCSLSCQGVFLFVHPSQHSFSYVGTGLPGLNQC